MINCDEVYSKYMELSLDDLQNYLEQVALEHNYKNYTSICSILNIYSKKELDKLEQEKFEKKKKQFNAHRTTYVQIIDEFIDNNYGDPINLLSLGNKGAIIENLDKYLNIFPEKVKSIEYIKENLNDLIKNESKDFKLLLNNLLKHNCSKTKKYLIVTSSILLSKNDGEAIEILRNYSFSRDKYQEYLKNFNERFPNQKEEYSYLKVIYEKYVEYYNLEKDDPKKSNMSELSYALRIIKKIMNSGYSIEEYCSRCGGITIATAYRQLKYLNSNHPEEFSDIIKYFETKNNEELYRNIRVLSYKILSSKNFDLIDYYQYTKLSCDDFIKLAESVIYDQKVLEKLKIKLHLLTGSTRGKHKIHINKERELSGTRIINGIEVSKAEKEKVFKFMDDRNIPINIYTACLKKYLSGNLDLDEKTINLI